MRVQAMTPTATETTTPIEDRADWQIHAEARAKADAAGLCFRCATEHAFREVARVRGGQLELRTSKPCEACKGKVAA
jgi:hypothetical protein